MSALSAKYVLRTGGVLVSLCLLWLLSGCGGAAAPAASTRAKAQPAAAAPVPTPAVAHKGAATVILALPGPPSPELMAYSLAAKEGFYKRYGLTVKTERMKSNVEVAALDSGQVQFGSNLSPLLVAAAKGIPIRLLMVTDANSFDLVSQRRITTAQQLKGRSVGVTAPNGNFQLAAEAMLRHLGVSPKAVKFVFMKDNSAMYQALQAGVIDAGVLSEPLNAVAEAHGYHKLMNSAAVYDGALNGLATSESMIQSHPRRVDDMVAGTLQAVQFILAHPNRTTAFMAGYLHESAAAAKPLYRRLVREVHASGTTVTPSWVAATLKVAAPKDVSVPFDRVADTAPLTAARKSLASTSPATGY